MHIGFTSAVCSTWNCIAFFINHVNTGRWGWGAGALYIVHDDVSDDVAVVLFVGMARGDGPFRATRILSICV